MDSRARWTNEYAWAAAAQQRSVPNAQKFGVSIVTVLLVACTAVAVLDLMLMLSALR